jgi:hypothetical protein
VHPGKNKRTVIIALLIVVCISMALAVLWWPKGMTDVQRILAGEPYRCVGNSSWLDSYGRTRLAEDFIKSEGAKFSWVVEYSYALEGIAPKTTSRMIHTASGRTYVMDSSKTRDVAPGMWVESIAGDATSLTVFGPDELVNLSNDPNTDYICGFVPDIPDSEFELPPGVQAVTLSELGQPP